MKITVDTNVLIRLVVKDDPAQAARAAQTLAAADSVAVSLQTLCEMDWVLRTRYRLTRADIATALHALIATSKIVMNRPAAEAGLALFEAGGDFADGVIAYEGAWLGAETFISFDRQAVALLQRQGIGARLI